MGRRAGEARAATVAVYGVVFVAFIDVFAMLPTVAPYAASLGAGVLGVGLVIGAYSASNLVFNLVGGVLLDRVGRRRVLLWGLGLAAVSVAAYVLAATPAQLVTVRLAHGAAGGLLVPAVFTLAGDLAPAEGRGRVMGRVGAAIGAAAIVAPASAGVVRQAAGFPAVFAMVAALTAGGLVLAATTIPESAITPRPGPRAGGMVRLLHRRDLRVTLVAVAALTFAVGSLAAFLPLHAEAITGQAAVTGMLFTVYAVVAFLAMLSPLARSVDVRGPLRSTAAGLSGLALALAILVTAPSLPVTFIASGIFGLGYGLVFPAASGFLVAATAAAERGRVFGLFNASFSIGLAVGPPLSGALNTVVGSDPFLPAVIATLAGAAVVVARRRQLDRPSSPDGLDSPGTRSGGPA